MTAPTIDDHKADAVRYPACNCGAIWKQRGNLTGHCTNYHQTFDGITLFDRHQHTADDGHTICKNPADMTIKGQTLDRIDGVWRGPRMPDDVKARRFGR